MDAATLLKKTRTRLRKHKGRYAELARANPSFSHSWLAKVATGSISNPTVTSLQQLIEALDAFEGVVPSNVGKRIDTPEAVAQAFAVPPPVPAEPEPALVEAPPRAQTEEPDPDAVRVEPYVEVP